MLSGGLACLQNADGCVHFSLGVPGVLLEDERKSRAFAPAMLDPAMRISATSGVE